MEVPEPQGGRGARDPLLQDPPHQQGKAAPIFFKTRNKTMQIQNNHEFSKHFESSLSVSQTMWNETVRVLIICGMKLSIY